MLVGTERQLMKTLGQIAYEATSEGGKQNFGPWKQAPAVVRRVHEQMARAVKRAVTRRAARNERWRERYEFVLKMCEEFEHKLGEALDMERNSSNSTAERRPVGKDT
jgi:hypothetical protein